MAFSSQTYAYSPRKTHGLEQRGRTIAIGFVGPGNDLAQGGGSVSDQNGSFGGLLLQLRLGADLSQAALAARSGVSIAAISMLERGRRHGARRGTVEALARALRLTDEERDLFLRAAEAPPTVQGGRAGLPAHPSYPQRISDDWREAHAALAAGLPKSAAAMACRGVHAVCTNGTATARKPLRELIQDFGRASTLHPTMVEWALQIRLFERTLAHALDDGLDRVTPEEAATVVAFLDELLRQAYEVPDRLARLRAGATA
jgi:transcriptional regulator with XRE-family HTH domain